MTIAYDEMINKLKERLDKSTPNMMNRHKFHSRVQGIEEPAENYVLALKLLASECGFGTHREEAIKDKIIFGLRDQELKQQLLMKDGMSLNEVEELVIRSELAKLRAKELSCNEDGASRSVNSVKHRLGHTDQRSGLARPVRYYALWGHCMEAGGQKYFHRFTEVLFIFSSRCDQNILLKTICEHFTINF